MEAAKEFLKKGGILLGESCPKCGGIQIRYKARNICVNCSNLSDKKMIETVSITDSLSSLRDIVLGKIDEVSSILSREVDVERQTKIAQLLINYLEVIKKIVKDAESKKESSEKENGT